ncbi:hypothetical protein P3S67_010557 [Capsicum chacoense]
MATEVLRPQDILIRRLRVSPLACYRRRTNFENENRNDCFNLRSSSNGNRKLVVKTEKERFEKKKMKNQLEPLMMRRRATLSEDLRPSDDEKSNGNDGIVMGQVTILRRGESMNSLKSIYTDKKFGPVQPELLSPKQIRVGLSSTDVYAGSAFSNSPSPRALPLPSFFNTKKQEDFATRDLRRLLRLEY